MIDVIMRREGHVSRYGLTQKHIGPRTRMPPTTPIREACADRPCPAKGRLISQRPHVSLITAEHNAAQMTDQYKNRYIPRIHTTTIHSKGAFAQSIRRRRRANQVRRSRHLHPDPCITTTEYLDILQRDTYTRKDAGRRGSSHVAHGSNWLGQGGSIVLCSRR